VPFYGIALLLCGLGQRVSGRDVSDLHVCLLSVSGGFAFSVVVLETFFGEDASRHRVCSPS
jgi:hypothetical protein